MALGSKYHDSDRGTVRVYQWNGSSWDIIGADGDLEGEAGDFAGSSVALSSDGTIVAVGATNYDSNKGTVRVYQWNGTSWNMLGKEEELKEK